MYFLCVKLCPGPGIELANERKNRLDCPSGATVTHALHGNEIRPFVRERANEETSFKFLHEIDFAVTSRVPTWLMVKKRVT